MRYILFLLLLPCILFADTDPSALILPNINPPPGITQDQSNQVNADGDRDMNNSGRPGWQLTNGVWIYTTSFNNDPTVKGNFVDTKPDFTSFNGLYLATAQQSLPNGLNVAYTYAANAATSNPPNTNFDQNNPPTAISATYHDAQLDADIAWDYTVSKGVSTLSSITYKGTMLTYVNGQPSMLIYPNGYQISYSSLTGDLKTLVDGNLAAISQVAKDLNTPPATTSTLLPKTEVETNKIIQPTPQPLPKEKTIQDYSKHK